MRGAASGLAALLGIGLRGLRSRLLLTLGSVLLASIAVAAAVVGPMYQSASANSFLVSRLRAEAGSVSGLTLDYRSSGDATDVTDAQRGALGALDPYGMDHFAEPDVTIRSTDLSVPGWGSPAEDDPQAVLVSGAALCEVLVVSGRCPERAGEMLMLDADASFTGMQVGQRAAVDHVARPLTLVGTYRLPPGQEIFDPSQFASVAAQHAFSGDTPYRPAPLVVTATTIENLPPSQWFVRMDLRLQVSVDTGLADMEQAVREVRRLVPQVAPQRKTAPLSLLPGNELAAVVDEADSRRATGRQTVTPAVVSLVLVAMVLLARMLSAATELRQPELALAALRGVGRRQVWVLGMLEPVLILGLSAPIGVAAGYLAADRFATQWLVPGLPLPVGGAVAWAVAGVLATAFALAALVVRSTTARPLDVQLTRVRRPSAAGRWMAVGRLGLVAAAVAVLVVATGSGHRDEPSGADIVLPILLAAAAGLVVGQLTWRTAGWWVKHTPRRRSMVQFIAARTVARRQESSAVILPFTAALAISVFAVGIYATAANWRASDAATQVGAESAYTAPIPLSQAMDLTHRLDPDGQWLMAVGVTSVAGTNVIVDAPRLARVAVWPTSWTTGMGADEVARALSPARRTLAVTGRRVQATVTNDVRLASKQLLLGIDVVTRSGEVRHIYVGDFKPGRSTRSAVVGFCGDGCLVTGLKITGPATDPERLRGTLEVSDVRVDGTRVPYFTGIGWRADDDSDLYGAPSVVQSDAEGGRLTVRLDSRGQPGIAALAPGDVPAVVPVIAGRDSAVPRPDWNLNEPDAASQARNLPVRVVETSESIPVLGPTATMVDYTAYTRTQQVIEPQTSVFILARADTPSDVTAALAGSAITQRTTLAEVRGVLDQDAYALSLNLYLVVSAIVVLMALVGLGVNLAVQLPARRSDAASLRVVGVRRQVIVLAAAAEHAVVLGAAAGAGILVGSLSQYVVTRTLTLGYSSGITTPRVQPAIDVGTTTALLVGAWAALLTVAVLLGALTIRAARTGTLRESVG